MTGGCGLNHDTYIASAPLDIPAQPDSESTALKRRKDIADSTRARLGSHTVASLIAALMPRHFGVDDNATLTNLTKDELEDCYVYYRDGHRACIICGADISSHRAFHTCAGVCQSRFMTMRRKHYKMKRMVTLHKPLFAALAELDKQSGLTKDDVQAMPMLRPFITPADANSDEQYDA